MARLPLIPPETKSLLYVVGWPSLSAIKVGNASSINRVKRWTSMKDGKLLRLEAFPTWYGCALREGVLAMALTQASWPKRWQYKHEARPHLGSRTDGWTEFYDADPCEWPKFLNIIQSTIEEGGADLCAHPKHQA